MRSERDCARGVLAAEGWLRGWVLGEEKAGRTGEGMDGDPMGCQMEIKRAGELRKKRDAD